MSASVPETRVLVMVNRSKPSAGDACDTVVETLGRSGRVIRVVDAIEPEWLPEAGAVDAAIVLGGDGTILRAAKLCLGLGCPLVGVNTGKVGFMAGYELGRFLNEAPRIMHDVSRHAQRHAPLMRAAISGSAAREDDAPIALNDFVITAGPPYRMIEIDISIDGHPGPTIAGDGVIVSSPIGSTAYSVSSGGPIVAPGVRAWVVVPIAAHSLSFRPIVVDADSVISLTLRSANSDNGHGTSLLADGQPCVRVAEGDRVEVRDDGRGVSFLVDPGVDYWTTLIRKMRWAQAPGGHGITDD